MKTFVYRKSVKNFQNEPAMDRGEYVELKNDYFSH